MGCVLLKMVNKCSNKKFFIKIRSYVENNLIFPGSLPFSLFLSLELE